MSDDHSSLTLLPAASQSPLQSATRLQKEYAELGSCPLPNCSAGPKGDSLYEWSATLLGPEGTVYEGGLFFVDLTFPVTYPYKPPRVVFKTRIYHCNINSRGVVCLDILGDKWSPAMTMSGVLMALCALLTECNPLDPLVGEIGHKYVHARAEHDSTARLWTSRYAR